MTARALRWAPRILGIASALFLGLFALDVFGEGRGFWQTAAALAIHLTPSALLLAVVAIAWRREWVGAALFAALGCTYAYWARRHPDWVPVVAGPLFLAAALYLAGWLARLRSRAE